MDLAMHFGMPADELARRMTEREFSQWAHRARVKGLPLQRFEWYFAQLTQFVASVWGGAEGVKPEDFVLKLEVRKQQSAVDEAKAFFGFAPRKKKA